MPEPELTGPYEADNGRDAYGHKVNAFGRCQYLNEDPPNCPRQGEAEWSAEQEPDGRD
jgi:hypothetical protein